MEKYVYLFTSLLMAVGCSEQVEDTKPPSIQISISKVTPENLDGRTKYIINPSGGTYHDGDQMLIRWNSSGGVSSTVNIDIVNNTTQNPSIVFPIASNLPYYNGGVGGEGRYLWTIPYIGSGFFPGTRYIRLTRVGISGSSDFSTIFTMDFSGKGTSFANPIDAGVVQPGAWYSDSKYDFNSNFVNNYGFGGDDIYYRFMVNSARTIHIGNCNELHGFNLYLFDASLNLLTTGTVGNCDNGSRIDTDLPVGTYYVISEGEPDGQYVFPYQLLTTIW